MRNIWKRPEVPQKGWRLIYVDDLEDAEFKCQMCGKKEIRYVHVVVHSSWPKMKVGRVCCENMTQDYVTPRKKEKQRRNLSARIARMASSARWKTTKNGNKWIKTKRGDIVCIIFSGKKIKLAINGKIGKLFYDTKIQAIERALLFLDSQRTTTPSTPMLRK